MSSLLHRIDWNRAPQIACIGRDGRWTVADDDGGRNEEEEDSDGDEYDDDADGDRYDDDDDDDVLKNRMVSNRPSHDDCIEEALSW